MATRPSPVGFLMVGPKPPTVQVGRAVSRPVTLARAFDEFCDRPGVRTSVGTIRFVGVWNARVQFKDAVSRQLIKVVVFGLRDNGGVGGGGAQHPDPLVPAALFCAVQRTVGQVEPRAGDAVVFDGLSAAWLA